MRAAIFGATIEDVPRMLAFVRVSSQITHSDPKAGYGAITVALAAREAKQSRNQSGLNTERWLNDVIEAIGKDESELVKLRREAIANVAADESTIAFAKSLGLGNGVTGYTYHTVPIAIHAWLSFPSDFQKAVTTMIQCGGDPDTTAAIVGGIVGAGVASGQPSEPVDRLFPLAILIRNIFFLAVVLSHGVRRLAPPY